jgi:hypothetical protein
MTSGMGFYPDCPGIRSVQFQDNNFEQLELRYSLTKRLPTGGSHQMSWTEGQMFDDVVGR